MMLGLYSPRWTDLRHAYGTGASTVALLRMLEANPDVLTFTGNWNLEMGLPLAEPWSSLWMSICHQGTVYTASYAAVPHIVRIASLAADPPALEYFLLPASIERGRIQPVGGPHHAVSIPAYLQDSYFEAIQELPALIPRLAKVPWDGFAAIEIASALLNLCGQKELGDILQTSGFRNYLQYRGKPAYQVDLEEWRKLADGNPRPSAPDKHLYTEEDYRAIEFLFDDDGGTL